MSQQRVLDYVAENGEVSMPEIKIEGMSKKAVSLALGRLSHNGSLFKRDIVDGGRRVVMYRAVSLTKEPEYSYILRNLPREVVCHD